MTVSLDYFGFKWHIFICLWSYTYIQKNICMPFSSNKDLKGKSKDSSLQTDYD